MEEPLLVTHKNKDDEWDHLALLASICEQQVPLTQKILGDTAESESGVTICQLPQDFISEHPWCQQHFQKSTAQHSKFLKDEIEKKSGIVF